MDQTLGDFIKTLRNADVRVSSTEVVDAHEVIDLIGYTDREMLKNALALVLPKTADEKGIFDYTFDRFFKFDELDEMEMADRNDAASDAGIVPQLDDTAGQQGEGQGEGGGKGCAARGGEGGEGDEGQPRSIASGHARPRRPTSGKRKLRGAVRAGRKPRGGVHRRAGAAARE